MLGQLRRRLTYANVVSTLALFLVLGTGTAYATHLVVNSSDVVDESLVSADLKNGSAVKAADVVDASLTGTDVAQDSLTGADIKEGTLGQVRNAMTATVGGLGRSEAQFHCNPEPSGTGGLNWVRCVQVTLNLPSPSRVLLNGRITVQYEPNPGDGECRWGGVQESGPVYASSGPGMVADLSLVGVTNVLPAGSFTFAIECTDRVGGGFYTNAWITAVAISPS